jgi:two-component system OmpR family sensor kinase
VIRQLVASYVLLVAAALAAFTAPVAVTLTQQVYGDAEGSARREAQVAALVLATDDESSRQALVQLMTAYSQQTPGRLDVLPAVGGPPAPVAPADAAFTEALEGREFLRWGTPTRSPRTAWSSPCRPALRTGRWWARCASATRRSR